LKFAIPLLLGTVLSTHAMAFDQCTPGQSDPQVRTCVYSPMQRYLVTGIVGYPVDLRFGETEHIWRTEFAYTWVDAKGNPAASWRAPKAREGEALPKDRYANNLAIWPFHEGRSALLVATRTPDGAERIYQFTLVANVSGDCTASLTAPGCEADNQTTSALMFAYPADVAAQKVAATAQQHQAAVAAWQATQAKAKEDAAIARLKTDAFYGHRNFRYQAKADPQFKALAPAHVSDNGWLTAFQWPENVQIPAITMLDPASGEERVAPVMQQEGQGRIQVINGTSEWFRLRLGKAVMDIHNLAWSPDRPDPNTGTTSPDVTRQVIYGDAK
jgi:type IV secretory pathway VirB9-like protein